MRSTIDEAAAGLARFIRLPQQQHAELVADIQAEARKPWLVRRFRWAAVAYYWMRRLTRS